MSVKLSKLQKEVMDKLAKTPIKCVEYWPPAKALIRRELAYHDDGWLVLSQKGAEFLNLQLP